MSGGYGKRLRLRLFLEGIEIPVISAYVQAAPNSPTTCSIQIPPLPEGTRLLPRTLVHLFFLDDYEAKLPFMTMGTKRTGTTQRTPTEYQKDEDRLKGFIPNEPVEDTNASGSSDPSGTTITQYKLLFGGETIGFVWNKNPSQRSLVLQCADWSNYWDYAYQYGNTGIFGPGRKVLFSGGATNLFTDFLESKGSVITRIVASGRCNSFPQLRGFAAGIIRLMEAIGGVYYPNPNAKDQKRIAGQNLFFSTAELRLHITHMVAAFEKDPTSERLLRRDGWASLFGRQLGGLGGQVSIRKAINALSGIIFHETYGQPCPYYKPGTDNSVSGRKRVKLKADPDLGVLASTAEGVQSALKAISTLLSDVTSEQIASIGGLGQFRDGITTRLADQRRTLNRLQTTAAARKAPGAAISFISQAASNISKATTAFEGWRPDAPKATRSKITTLLDTAGSKLDQLSSFVVYSTPKNLREPARLNQHIYRPDIWFGPPPRCNVLFPEDYDSITYQRMFLQEPTRLLLKTNDEFFGEDFLFDRFYFAPQAGSVKADRARMQDMMRGDVLDHELFTGILPVFEKSGEFNVFAGSKNLTATQKKDYQKQGFAQRSANFLYFKYRFNSRQMQVGGKFNPYIACGFPGLIIDKPVDQATAALHNELRRKADLPQQKISEALGTNFLGNFTQVTHSVSQADGRARTEIACAYPRQPEESVEFLGATERTQTIRKKVGSGTIRATDVAAINAPKLYSLGPNGGRISNVTDVTASYASGNVDNRVPLYNAKGKRGGRVQAVFVPVGVPTTAQALGSPDVAEQVGDPLREVVFSAFRVEEEVPRYRKEQVDIPAEELIRPGWYGDVWSPPKIGAVYQDFFGTGSITDPQKVSDDFNVGQRVPSEAAEQASEEQDTARDVNDPRNDALAFLTLDEGSSIQDAVDFLTLTYSYIRQNGLNIDEFIRAYTWRPIASIVDIFGTTDLQFSPDGQDVLQGIEGFHSRAFGPYDDLFGLTSPEIEDILGIKKNTASAHKADTRKIKQEAVQQLSAALTFSRGILG